MPRVALGIEYNGHSYNGWQKQKHHIDLRSVQNELEMALGKVADNDVAIYCAGRTDSKVHATGQVVHFDYDSNKSRDLSAWILGGNSSLPMDISINWACEVDSNFHARHSALSRRYHYYFYNFPVKRALLSNRALWLNKKLDIEAMQQACQYLLGEQDFSSLRSSKCESRTPFRNIISADIKISNNFIWLDVKANAFLHHMVRNIVGCLLEIGLGNKPSSWMGQVLSAKDRKQAAKTAAPDGLYLVEVEYPDSYKLSNHIISPF